MAKLEQLEIDIVAKTQNGATKGVKNLADALKQLADAAENVAGVAKVAYSLGRLAEATKDVGNAPTNIRKLGTALKHLVSDSNGVDTIADGLVKVADAIATIAEAGTGLVGVAGDIRDINSAAKSAAKNTEIPQGGTGLTPSNEPPIDTGTAEVIEEVGRAADISADKIARLEEALMQSAHAAEIEENIDGATASLREMSRILTETTWDDVSDAFDRLFEAIGNGNSKDISAEIESVVTALSNLPPVVEEAGNAADLSADKIDRLEEALMEAAHAAEIDGDISAATESLKEMGRILTETTWDEASDAFDRLFEAIEGGNSGDVAAALRDVQNVVSNLPPEIEEAISTVEVRLNLASRAVQEFGETIQGVCMAGVASLKGLAKGFSKVLALGMELVRLPFKRFADSLSTVGHKMRNIVSSVGRIAMYRAIRTAIKAITTGFSEGIKHLYQWSQLVGDNFTHSMDSLATSAHYLRDSLGAMASPLIDAVAPAIEMLTERFVSLLNVVNQFIAALTGKDTWRKAVRTPTTYSGAMKEAAENTKKATKAQKELNKVLAGFDELNLLTTNEINARKPSTTTGKEPEVTSTEFETKPIDDWIQSIRDAIEKGDWAGAGTLLAEKLNGMVQEWKAKEFGNKIGAKFQKALDFYLAFMETVEWEDLGKKVGQMFSGIFETMSATDLGHALVAHIKAGVKLAKGFLEEAEPAFQALGVAVSTAINDFFDPDFAVELGETIAAGVNDAITFLKTLVVGTEKVLQNYDTGETITVKVGGIDFKQVGESLMTSIFTAIGEIKWADLGETAAGIFTGIIDAIGAGVEYAANNIGKIATAIKDFAFAFFGGIWEWFWPAAFQFLTGGEGYTYQGGDGNDRPNSPVTTGQGAKTMEGFNQEVTEATDWLTERWKWLNEHNPLNLDVTDTGNTIKTQDSNVQGLNKDLDHTDGTFTSWFKTANLMGSDGVKKKVSGYEGILDDVDGTRKTTFKTEKLSDRKKAADSYQGTLAKIGKTVTTTFETSKLAATKLAVEGLQKALDDLAKQKNINVKMTVDVLQGGTRQQELVVNNYFGTGMTAHAEGGFPQGTLFVAGEVPGQAEMVGNINGRTGVASGKEITGIADAVYNTGEVEANLLREQNALLRQLYGKRTEVSLAPNVAAGRWINQAQTAYARATGG